LLCVRAIGCFASGKDVWWRRRRKRRKTESMAIKNSFPKYKPMPRRRIKREEGKKRETKKCLLVHGLPPAQTDRKIA
jgi:uncharacterized iron-regulated membrane protein